jgi:thiol:disulfide interchange protein DsbA
MKARRIKMKKIILFGALLLCSAGLVQAQTGASQNYVDGVHYFTLNQASTPRKSDVISVTEIFSYGCHACNDFEPYMQNWKAKQASDVKLNRIPVGFGNPSWELLAKAYVMAEILGEEEENHVPLMDALWKEKRQMRSLDALANFYAERGVDKAKFMALDNSFMLNMRQKQNQDKLAIYAPRGTPTMVVNGKYKIVTGQAVPNYSALLSVVDFLVAKERGGLAPVAAVQDVETAADTAAN